MNKKSKNKKVAVLLFFAVTVLAFFSCQTALYLEEITSQTDLTDFKSRPYEPARIRFATTDPQSEPSISPFAWAVRTQALPCPRY